VTQEYQSIGGVSPQLDAVCEEKQGWQGETPEDLGAQLTRASDFSFRARRANRQALTMAYPGPGRPEPVENMAGYAEPSMAGREISPPGEVVLPPSEDRMQVTW